MNIKAPSIADHITLKQLRIFTAYAKAGSMKDAANHLHISAPAISQQLRALEINVGATLAVKDKGGVRLTRFGKVVLLSAKAIENHIQDCQLACNKLNMIEFGKVSIGIFSSANYFAPYVIAEFKKLYPEAEVRVCIGNRNNIFQAFRNQQYDFLIVGRPPEEEGFESVEIGNHPHIVIGSPSHPLINQKKLRLEDLANESFLIREPGSGTRLAVMRLFEDIGIAPRLTMEVGNNESVKQAVMADLGIAFISAHTVAAELAEGSVKVFDIAGFPIIRKWLVVKHRDIPLAPTAQALLNYFVESGSQFFPDSKAVTLN